MFSASTRTGQPPRTRRPGRPGRARTGQVIWRRPPRGCGPRRGHRHRSPHRGAEMWAAPGLRTCRGEPIARAPLLQFRRLVGRRPAPRTPGSQRHLKWNWEKARRRPSSPPKVVSNNGTKATPALSADISATGERKSFPDDDNRALRLYTTTIPPAPHPHADARPAVPPERGLAERRPTTNRRTQASTSAKE